ncbi:MAG: hypothetical protein KDI44_09445 [Thiothrix sp.]|nr:hypothetical protein [Thiothrix sp.]HPQ95465.1 hypothetical protein [Thiolinea sp.]
MQQHSGQQIWGELVMRVYFIQNGAHPGITGRSGNPVQLAQVVLAYRRVIQQVIEGKRSGIFQAEQGYC